MSFKLSAQLDEVGNPNLPFQMYASYLENNKHRFPKSVIDVISNPNWSGGSQSNSPYYGQLVKVKIQNIGNSTASLKLTLRKEMYVPKPFHVELLYSGLLKLNIPNQNNLSSNMTWRYEQFLYFDDYKNHTPQDKFFTHQIEWVSGEIWSITAREIDVKCIDL